MIYNTSLICMAIYYLIASLLVLPLIILLYGYPTDNRSNIVTGFFDLEKEKRMPLPRCHKVEL